MRDGSRSRAARVDQVGTRPWTTTFGRDADVARVLDLLTDSTTRLVTIAGRAGVGKTHLARHIADRCPASNTAVVPLAGVLEAALVVPTIASVLAVPALGSGDASDALVLHLRTRPFMLVLDNLEHLHGVGAVLGWLLDRCPRLTLLTTSQAALGLRSERVVTLPPLPVPTAESPDVATLMDEPAVALYCDRAAAVDGRFALTAENAPAVSELCRRLEGLPLAIELAAARALTLPAAELLRRLDDAGLDLLHRNHADAPARHHDLRAAIDWTYRLLDEPEQRLLQRCSALGSWFTSDVVEAVSTNIATADVLDQLGTLVDFHLIDPVPDSQPLRFAVPSSIRSFAAEHLGRSDQTAAVQRSYLAWLAHQAREAVHTVDSDDELRWIENAEALQPDFLHGANVALRLGAVDEALDIARALALRWQYRGYTSAHGELILDRVLDLAEQKQVQTSPHAGVLGLTALLGFQSGERARQATSARYLDRAESLARSLGDDISVLRVLAVRMLTAPFGGDLANVVPFGEQGIALARDAGNPRWLGRFLVWTSAACHTSNDNERAVALGRAGLATARAEGDIRTIITAAIVLSPLRDAHPQLINEAPSTADALELARAVGLDLYIAGLTPVLAMEEAARGEVDAAVRHCVEGLEIVRPSSSEPFKVFALGAAVETAAAAGDLPFAAYVHGAMRRVDTAARGYPSPRGLAAHAAVLRRVREALGQAKFSVHTARGGAVSIPQMTEQALTYMQRLVREPGHDSVAAAPSTGLRQRQLEVLALLATGLRNKEIAEKLHLAPKTVTHHVSAIYQTLGVRGRSEATAWAIRNGILD